MATIYVKPQESGDGSGTSWDNASTLDVALESAGSGDQIWVAAGDYIPTTCWNVLTGTKDEAPCSFIFHIPSGVHVYGGFKGDETSLEQRNFIKNVTTLLGNDLHVVFFFKAADTTRLDGFTITNGSATVGNDLDGTGGGILINGSDGNCKPTIANCILQNNEAELAGGGGYEYSSY